MFRARAMEQCPIACAQKTIMAPQLLQLFLRLLKLEERLFVNERRLSVEFILTRGLQTCDLLLV